MRERGRLVSGAGEVWSRVEAVLAQCSAAIDDGVSLSPSVDEELSSAVDALIVHLKTRPVAEREAGLRRLSELMHDVGGMPREQAEPSSSAVDDAKWRVFLAEAAVVSPSGVEAHMGRLGRQLGRLMDDGHDARVLLIDWVSCLPDGLRQMMGPKIEAFADAAAGARRDASSGVPVVRGELRQARRARIRAAKKTGRS